MSSNYPTPQRPKNLTDVLAGVTQGNASQTTYKLFRQFGEYPYNAPLTRKDILVGYWPFEEGGGTTTRDMGPDGYVGTLAGSPAWVLGRFGNALTLTGAQNVSLGTPSALQFNGLAPFSLTAWFKVITTTGTDAYPFLLHGVYTDGGGREDWDLFVDTNSSTLAVGFERFLNGAEDGAATAITSGVFHHVAATYDGTTMRLYLDGVYKASSASSMSLVSGPRTIYVGQGASTSVILLDEVRIYSRALSDGGISVGQTAGGDIAALYAEVPGQAPVDYLSAYNATSRGTVLSENLAALDALWAAQQTDMTFKFGGNRDGTLVNSPTWVADQWDGNALKFASASSQQIAIITLVDPPTAALTLAAWVKPTTLPGTTMEIMEFGSWNLAGSAIIYITSGNVFAFGVSTPDTQIDSNALTAGTWYHVVGTFDGTNLKLYVNGALVASGTNSRSLTGTTLQIANGAASYLNGTLDEVRMYNRALSAGEVTALYNHVRKKGGLDHFLRNGLVGYWPFDEGTGTTAKDWGGSLTMGFSDLGV